MKEIDLMILPEGDGKYIDEEGNYYIGNFKNRLKHGKGTEHNQNRNIIYEVEVAEAKKEGNGKYIFKDSDYYI